ncbi:MAG: cellulose-binding [Verrucomicrobiales bacterium]|nr:cellulose-binding [Verrucomicrobiales bacterium]
MKNLVLRLIAMLLLLQSAETQALESAWTGFFPKNSGSPGPTPSFPLAIKRGRDGNVYVSGGAQITGGYDLFMIKCSASGIPLWTNYGGTTWVDVAPLAIDANNNVIVAVEGAGTIKYSSDGVLLWNNPISNGIPYSIGIDSGGAVFIAGAPGFVIKYSGSGVPLWTNNFDFQGSTLAQQLVIDANDDVLVSGGGGGFSGGTPMVLIKYSNNGIPLWTNTFIEDADGSASGGGLSIDQNGNVIVTSFSVANNIEAFATLKYSSNGVPLWTNLFRGSLNNHQLGYDYPGGQAVDGSGNVIVTGRSTGPNGYWDMTTIKYSSAGLPLWTNRLATASGSSGFNVDVDKAGNVFVLGSSDTGQSLFIYSSAGQLL